MAGKAVPLVERFHKHYILEPNSGCWLWLSATVSSKYGGPYGVIGADKGDEKKMLLAHRASYRLHVGGITKGMQIDHTCENTLCVNPEHLQVLTPKQHVKLTYVRAFGNCCKRGHFMDEKNTWIEKTGTRHCRRCHADIEARNRTLRKAKLFCIEAN